MIFNLFILGFLFTCGDAISSCKNLIATDYASDVCYGAVDYSFYLPSGYSLTAFNTIATSLLSSVSLATLPVECQKGLKKLVCSNVYLKCPSGINLTSNVYHNWNFNIYSDLYPQLSKLTISNHSLVPSPYIPMPFQRPCKSVCTSLVSKCYGMLSLFGISQNCTARYDYSSGSLSALYSAFPSLPYPYKYDQRNASGVCNAMTASFSLAATSEPYLQAANKNGACYGITSSLYIPSGPLVSTSLAPMQQSYLVQTALESALSTTFNSLPVYMSQSCHHALRKYFCGSYMLAPSKQTYSAVMRRAGINDYMQEALVAAGAISAELLTYSFYLPSYPHHDVCTEYSTYCAEFITAANISALVPSCNAVKSGVIQFPTSNQTLSSVPLTILGTSYTLQFSTPPNQMQSTTDAYETQCPEGFVVPNKEDDRTTWITGTGCAIACKLPVWNDSEWDLLLSMNVVGSWISLILMSFLIVSWVLDAEKMKHQYLVLCYAIYAWITSLMSAITTTVSFETAFCATNAVPLDETDGVNICSAQVIMDILSAHGTAVSWCLISFDLFLKVGLGKRHTSRFKYCYLFIIIVEPIIFMAYATKIRFGFTKILPVCSLTSPTTTDLSDQFVPLTIFCCIGTVTMLFIIYKITMSMIRTSSGGGDASTIEVAAETLKKVSMLKTPSLFLIVYLAITLSFVATRIPLPVYNRRTVTGITNFATCVFASFDGSDSWKSDCKDHPTSRFPYSTYGLMAFFIAFSGALTSFIYLANKSIWISWSTRLGLRSSSLTRQIKYNKTEPDRNPPNASVKIMTVAVNEKKG